MAAFRFFCPIEQAQLPPLLFLFNSVNKEKTAEGLDQP